VSKGTASGTPGGGGAEGTACLLALGWTPACSAGYRQLRVQTPALGAEGYTGYKEVKQGVPASFQTKEVLQRTTG
jgi:hypothetical protein